MGGRNVINTKDDRITKMYPDAIFIGAINYDYIFQGNASNGKIFVFHGLEEGDEALRWERNNGSFDVKIQEMYENYDFKSKQIGGSAYLALRAFKASSPSSRP